MSLSAKVNAAVNKAFAAAGDLVKTATLSNKSVSSYNFATRSVESFTSTLNVEVIITTSNKASGESINASAIMKSGVDLSVYDTLTVEDKAYKIVSYTDNHFVIEAQLAKEVA